MTTGQYGFDRVRNVVIGRPDIELEYFEEVSPPIQAFCASPQHCSTVDHIVEGTCLLSFLVSSSPTLLQ